MIQVTATQARRELKSNSAVESQALEGTFIHPGSVMQSKETEQRTQKYLSRGHIPSSAKGDRDHHTCIHGIHDKSTANRPWVLLHPACSVLFLPELAASTWVKQEQGSSSFSANDFLFPNSFFFPHQWIVPSFHLLFTLYLTVCKPQSLFSSFCFIFLNTH